MKVLIVHAHPEPESFNGAMTRRATQVLTDAGHDVTVSDLCAMEWEAVTSRDNFTTTADPDYFKQQVEEAHASENGGFAADIQGEIDKLFACDLLILQFPLSWFSVPAILKGWIDRVFAIGTVYGDGTMLDTGRLAGRKALVAMTTGGPEALYTPEGLGEINDILYPVQFGALRFTGFEVLEPFIAWAPAHIGQDGREQQLDAYEARLKGLDDETPMTFPTLITGEVAHG